MKRGKTGKHGKVVKKEKMVDFRSTSLLPARKREVSRRRGEPREPVSSKPGRTSKTVGAFQKHPLEPRLRTILFNI